MIQGMQNYPPPNGWSSKDLQQYAQSAQAIANRQFNAYAAIKQPSEFDKRLLEVRQNQYNIRRKMWSMLK